MAKRNKPHLTKEDKIIDLLEKSIIIDLISKNVSRENIKDILGIGTDKVTIVLKHFNKKGGKNA